MRVSRNLQYDLAISTLSVHMYAIRLNELSICLYCASVCTEVKADKHATVLKVELGEQWVKQ